jgi:hypothetical protein
MGQQDQKSSPQIERRFVSTRGLAEFLNGMRSERTLEMDRLRGGGFPHYRIGGRIVYDLNEVIRIIEQTRQDGTAA